MSWRTVRLGDLVEYFSVKAKDVGGADGLDFYGVSNEEGIIKTKYAAEDKAEDYKIIEKGCFAYNPYRVNVGSIGLVSDDTRGLISPAYVVFKPKPNCIIPELLFKFLKSDEGLRQIKFYARGTVRQALRFEDLCNIEITIPEYDDQQNLNRKLIKSQEASNILDAELKNQLEFLKQLRQQLLQDAVQGKLVEQNPKDEPASQLLKKIKAEKQKLISEKKLKKEKDLPPINPEEIPFEIPDNWVWCRLGEICNYGSSQKAEPKSLNDNTWVLDLEDIEKETSNLLCKVRFNERNSLSTKSKFKKGEVLYSKLRPYLDKVIVADEDGVCTTEILPLKLYGDLNPFYVRFTLKRIDFIKYVNSVTKGMKMPRLGTTDGQIALVPLSPLAEQKRIVQKLDELMKCCNELESSIKQSESQNEKLLQQVLREALRKEPVVS